MESPTLFFVYLFTYLIGVVVLGLLIKYVINKVEELDFEREYLNLKGMVLHDSINKVNFGKIELEFAIIKCYFASQGKVTALWNTFLQRFDREKILREKIKNLRGYIEPTNDEIEKMINNLKTKNNA